MTDEDTIHEDSDGVLDFVEQFSEKIQSRRKFMGDAAKVGGGALALSAVGSGAAAAQSSGDSGNSGVSDLDVLNFALTLERLETAFYQDALASSGGMFSEHDAERSANAKYFARPTLRYSTYQQFEQIRDQEGRHVKLLETAITDTGGTPVGKADYTFPSYKNFKEFAALARTFEKIGSAAYTRGADLLTNTDYLAQAARILAVEARHESYLREINLQRGFPYAFQPTMTVAEIKSEIAPFIESIPESSGLTEGQQATMIETGSGDHTIRLNAQIPGWQGVAPDSIKGKTNPTLPLQKGETYDITWKEIGESAHELILTDDSGNVLAKTEDAEEKGETRTVSITATDDVTDYHCDFHPLTMYGEINVSG